LFNPEGAERKEDAEKERVRILIRETPSLSVSSATSVPLW